MARKLDPAIGDVLKKYGYGSDAAWDCHGVWVVYHKILEQIAARSGIIYEQPTVLVAEKDCAAILVTGRLGDKSEWSIGEAAIGTNYKISGKQAAYPFAMAEKRAKDRVILKLIGIHGLAFSEEEADDFKASNAPPPAQEPTREPAPKPERTDAQRQRAASDWCYKAKGFVDKWSPEKIDAWRRENADAIANARPLAPNAHKALLDAIEARTKQPQAA